MHRLDPSVSPRTRGRYAQCDDTCTTDCGHCKGAGPPAPPTVADGYVRVGAYAIPAAPLNLRAATADQGDARESVYVPTGAQEIDGLRVEVESRAAPNGTVDARWVASCLASIYNLTTRRPTEEQRERVADLLAAHGAYHVSGDGWTVCLCGHVAEGDDDGSYARHLADVILAAIPSLLGGGDQ